MTIFVAHARRERRTACVDANFQLWRDRTNQGSSISCETELIVPLFTQKVNQLA